MENISKEIEESIQKSSIPIQQQEVASSSSSTASSSSGTFLGIHWTIWIIILIVSFFLFALILSLFVSKMKDLRTQYSSFFDMLDILGQIGAKRKESDNQKSVEMVGMNAPSSLSNTDTNNNSNTNQNILGNMLNKPTPANQSQNQNATSSYIEDSNTSSIQQKGGKGFCYIGEDKGIRVCAKVDESDTCMSGNIFPTKDMCINPNLR